MIGNFTGKQYQNLVSYFNTYYNAKKVFNSALESINTTQSSPQGPGPAGSSLGTTSKYPVLSLLDIMGQDYSSSDAKAKFDQVIEKCSKILNNYPKSSLIDDALLLMGESYYYSSEYTRAERKFLELISQYPESDLIYEAKLWCGRSFLKNRREKDAFVMFNDLNDICLKEEMFEMIANINIILSSYHLVRKDTAKALISYQQILKYSKESELQAQANFRLGEIYEKYDSTALAAEYYLKSTNFTSLFNVKYWGLNKNAFLQKKMGNLDIALKSFIELKEGKLFQEYLPFTIYEIADIYDQKNNIDEAVSNYLYLDTTYVKTESAAKGYYKLGLIYERDFKDYLRAKVCYQRCREQGVTNLEVNLAEKRANDIDSYLNFRKNIPFLDSTLQSSYIPDTLHLMKYDTLWSEVKDSAKTLKIDSIGNKKKEFIKSDSTKTLDTLKDQLKIRQTNIIKHDSTKTTILHSDSSSHIKNITLQNIKPNENPKENIAKSSKDSLNKKSASEVILKKSKRKIDTILITKIAKIKPLDTLAIEKNIINLAKKKFEFGEFWLNNFDNVDSTLYWFKEAYEGYPKDSAFVTYIFKSAKAHEKKGEKDVSDSLYHVVIDKYPKSEFVNESKFRLGIPIIAVIDTAGEMYSVADSLLEKDQSSQALKLYDKICLIFPKSPFAAKSQYAIGWVHEYKNKDYKKAIESYRKLVELYPGTLYANQIQPRIDTIEKYFPTKKKPPKIDSSVLKPAPVKIEPIVTPITQTDQDKIALQNKEKFKPDTIAVMKPPQGQIRKRPIRQVEVDTNDIK
jgi:TolA-binding protein